MCCGNLGCGQNDPHSFWKTQRTQGVRMTAALAIAIQLIIEFGLKTV
jgi:hypothetical protein